MPTKAERAEDKARLFTMTLPDDQSTLLLAILERLEDVEAAVYGTDEEALGIAPSDVTDSERQQYEAAKQWMGDFIVAVRGYVSSDLAEGGELAAMKDEMRSRVMNMLARGRPW
jgi:hypothetical protein